MQLRNKRLLHFPVLHVAPLKQIGHLLQAVVIGVEDEVNRIGWQARTVWAQVNGRDELPIPEKVKLDVAYLQRQSFWFDIQILWLTLVKVLRRDGVSH